MKLAVKKTLDISLKVLNFRPNVHKLHRGFLFCNFSHLSHFITICSPYSYWMLGWDEHTFRLKYFSMHQNWSAIFWLPANITWCWAWEPNIFKTRQHLALSRVLRTVKNWLLYLLLMQKVNYNENLALSSPESMGSDPELSIMCCSPGHSTGSSFPV